MSKLLPTSAAPTSPDNEQIRPLLYAISHDLAQPIRAAARFAQLLVEQHGPQLDDDAKTWLNYIRLDTDKALRMIDGLLQHSRLQSTPLQERWLDLSELTQQVWDDCRVLHADVETDIQLLPSRYEVFADRQQLYVLLSALFNNALTYRSTQQSCCLRVQFFEEHDVVRLVVEDNGIGVAREHYAQLTQLFRRLHDDELFPGIGLGLCYSEQILRRLGGHLSFATADLGGLAVHCHFPIMRYRTAIAP